MSRKHHSFGIAVKRHSSQQSLEPKENEEVIFRDERPRVHVKISNDGTFEFKGPSGGKELSQALRSWQEAVGTSSAVNHHGIIVHRSDSVYAQSLSSADEQRMLWMSIVGTPSKLEWLDKTGK